MEIELVLELTDVYGGDGFTRPLEVEKTKLSRTKKTAQMKKSVGVLVEDEVAEEKTDVDTKECATFERIDGAPVLRLGGGHGKLWGSLKSVAQQLRAGGDKDFSTYWALLNSISVRPSKVPLIIPSGVAMEVRQLSQELQGPSGGMIFPQFDVIPRCTVTVVLAFPGAFKDKVERLVNHLGDAGHLNKRRATIRPVTMKLIRTPADEKAGGWVRIEA